MKAGTVQRHVRKEESGREAAAAARDAEAQRLRTLGTEAAALLPTAAAKKRPAMEAAIRRGTAGSSAHRRAVDVAGQKARKRAMGHDPQRELAETVP